MDGAEFFNQHNQRTERKTKVVLIENRIIFLLCRDLLGFYPFAGIIIVLEFPALSIFRANIETNVYSTREQCFQLGTYSLYLSGKIKKMKKEIRNRFTYTVQTVLYETCSQLNRLSGQSCQKLKKVTSATLNWFITY